MVWAIDLIRISEAPLRQWRDRFFVSYVAILATLLGIFSTAIYHVVARDRNHQLNTHLTQLAETAAHTLDIVKHEYEELAHADQDDDDEDDDDDDDYATYAATLPRHADGSLRPISLNRLMGKYEAASILDLPQLNRPQNLQGVEWYDEHRRLMVREGSLFPAQPFPHPRQISGSFTQTGQLRTVILPVYRNGAKQPGAPLVGYIRASESTAALTAELDRLRWGLGLGAVLMTGLAAVSGIWLTRQALRPVVQSLTRLQQFTADASHELRNPLTAIRASVAVMQSHRERVDRADWGKLDAIATASAQMSHLVDDLLLLARMDQQWTEAPSWRRVAVDEILEDLVEFWSDRAAQAQITLTAHLQPNILMQGNPDQLHRLFNNLITNALTYSPAGSRVTVTLTHDSLTAIAMIQDTGIGIAPQHLPYIFDRFWRADPSRTPQDGGSGLGLAIVQGIVHQHRGKITVQSTPQQGSCFRVELPIH
ncbi:HAMP domain-containing sensor histidine kinase [Spirulina major CS-329]|uniref:sensor histidine kinase n=1 Tax=Spirulina TaxID=1154 RepID=UPI00232CC8F3|nr:MULTISPECIES: HAMP domain-containing sensor histidine kinase [Spirulina]MDB9493101.1 HAMP domain-containing sensor histidine kinase [Spirulina subsalsa CS-330]MDB9503093.1 HAMP domain-containing sensor histidine kinase [Spirulina major CS-329]